MIVFSNTTPFIALSSIGQLDLLPSLFSEVCIVPEVVEGMPSRWSHRGARANVLSVDKAAR